MVKKATTVDKSNKNNQAEDTNKVSDISDVFTANLETFMKTHGLTGKRLAEELGYSESTISGIRSGEKSPSLNFFLQLKSIYGISIDDFLTKKITPADYDAPPATSKLEEEELRDYAKFVGTYFLYYLDTSIYKGYNFDSPSEALRFGIMHVYANDSSIDKLSHSVVCVTGLETRQAAIELRSKIELAARNGTDIVSSIQNDYSDLAYYGDFDMTSRHVFITMRQSNRDQALIILHRTGEKQNHYNSGIGTINSVSRGRESMPTIQFIGFSRENTRLSDEELHEILLLDHISIIETGEINSLIKRIQKLYLTNEDNLSDFQRDISVKGEISAYVRKVVEWNLFRVAKISNRDDDSWYHKLKGTFLGEENT